MLQEALYTGRIADINKLYNASEFAREGSVRALQDQYQRMLQAGPIRRPLGPVRRTSSTPSFLTPTPATTSIHMRTQRTETPPGHWTATDDGAAREKKAEPKAIGMIEAAPANRSVKETDAPAAVDCSTEPLFCRYATELQNSSKPVDACYTNKGGSQACPVCGTRIAVEAGRAWKVEKEMFREVVSTPKYEDEVVSERTFLIGNRFIIKSHRETGGFGCVLCYRHRDSDTICESASGLVRHIWQKHDVAEYETDVDIREVWTQEERTSKKKY
jgi:hypothetical protein